VKARRSRSLPLADVASLLPAARRTRLLQLGLGSALLLALALAYLLAPGGDRGRAFAASGRGTMVVLDVSGSVDDVRPARLIRNALREEQDAAGPGGRVGLVLFSDTAMETLPPTAPASELATFRRFFVPLRHPRARTAPPGVRLPVAHFPRSPWEMFVGGTSISSGLREARLALARAGMGGGRVLLVSDLVDAPEDMPRLRRELALYVRDPGLDLKVRVLPSDLPQPLHLFRKQLGGAAVRPARVPLGPPAAPPRHPVSLSLVLAAAGVAVALALHELLGVPLRWREATA
jgi:hypothetical protein